MTTTLPKVGFAGLSHLGIVTSIALASKKFPVVAFDERTDLIADLRAHRLPIHEPRLAEILEGCGDGILFTHSKSDLKSCDIVYVAIDVKTDEQNVSDLSGIRALIADVGPHLKQGCVFVILSQVPPGFTRTVNLPHSKVHYQVETLIFGRAVERALYPERYMVGCADPGAPLPAPFKTLLSAFDCPILPMRYESAELAKISINMFLVSSVSVTNTLAEICESIGADWAEIAPALRLDRRIGQYAYLSPGLGIAGGIVDAWTTNSCYRRDWAIRTVHKRVLSLNDKPTIAVWGLAYKQDTKSIKNSPSVAFVESLGATAVRAYDPQVDLREQHQGSLPPGFSQVATALEACRGADALAVMTPWPEFAGVDLKEVKALMSGNTIIDPYAVLDASACERAGLNHSRLGKQ